MKQTLEVNTKWQQSIDKLIENTFEKKVKKKYNKPKKIQKLYKEKRRIKLKIYIPTSNTKLRK